VGLANDSVRANSRGRAPQEGPERPSEQPADSTGGTGTVSGPCTCLRAAQAAGPPGSRPAYAGRDTGHLHTLCHEDACQTRAFPGPAGVLAGPKPNPILPVQAFARGLDRAPACERLQAGLTEAGQALDGRALVAALGAAAAPDARAAPPGALAAGGAGLPARASAPGQRRLDAASGRAFQLNVELRLLRARQPLPPTRCCIARPCKLCNLATTEYSSARCSALRCTRSPKLHSSRTPCARLAGAAELNTCFFFPVYHEKSRSHYGVHEHGVHEDMHAFAALVFGYCPQTITTASAAGAAGGHGRGGARRAQGYLGGAGGRRRVGRRHHGRARGGGQGRRRGAAGVTGGRARRRPCSGAAAGGAAAGALASV